MHFWINKSQQVGCRASAYNSRYVPPSISAGTRRYTGHLPKPMVTPVHRFQSIESVQSHHHQLHHHHHHHHAGGRNVHLPSASAGSTAAPSAANLSVTSRGLIATQSSIQQQQQQHHRSRRITLDHATQMPGISIAANNANNVGHRNLVGNCTSVNNCTNVNAALPLAATSTGGSVISLGSTTRTSAASSKFKCVVWAIISLIPFLIVAGKYYFNGFQDNVGSELVVFFILLLLVLAAIGCVSLVDILTRKQHAASACVTATASPLALNHQTHATGVDQSIGTLMAYHDDSLENLQNAMQLEHAPHANLAHYGNPSDCNGELLPPPPYHIAVMLPAAGAMARKDSPPPTYEKCL